MCKILIFFQATIFRLGSKDETGCVLQKLNSQLERPFIQLVEFIDSATFDGYYSQLTQRQAESLGEIISFDLLVNNSDRIPAVHSNEGNGLNLLCPINDDDIVAIDTCIVSIDPLGSVSGPNLTRYLDKMRRFLRTVLLGNSSEITTLFEPIKQFVFNCTGHAISEESCISIAIGIRRMAMKISTVPFEKILRMREEIAALVSVDWCSVWERSLSLVNLGFLRACLGVFEECVEEKLSLEHAHSSTIFSPLPFASVPSEKASGAVDCPISDQRMGELKVMLAQRWPDSGQNWKMYLRTQIIDEIRRTGVSPHFIVLPEGALRYVGTLAFGSDPSSYCVDLQCLSEVCKEFKTHIICGTLLEVVSADQYYCTCVVLDDSGLIIGKYRKRDTMGAMCNGDSVGVFETKYGMIGVLICFDAERDAFVTETLAHNPFIIFNPTCLPIPRGYSDYPEMVASNWRIAQDSSSRRFEYLCRQHRICFARADVRGSGNSFAVSPFRTVLSPSMQQECFSVSFDLTQTSGTDLSTFSGNEGISRIRTEKEDNTGIRIVNRIVRTPFLSGLGNDFNSEKYSPVCVGNFSIHGRPKGGLFLVRVGSVELWDIATYTILMKMDVSETVGSMKYPGIQVLNAACSLDCSKFYVEGRTGRRFYWVRSDSKSYSFELVESEDYIWEGIMEAQLSSSSSTRLHDQLGRPWIVELCGPKVSCGLQSLERQYLFTYTNPVCDIPLNFHYDSKAGLLITVSSQFITFSQFMYNRVPVKLSDLFPIE